MLKKEKHFQEATFWDRFEIFLNLQSEFQNSNFEFWPLHSKLLFCTLYEAMLTSTDSMRVSVNQISKMFEVYSQLKVDAMIR
jgi:hypothetical protein